MTRLRTRILLAILSPALLLSSAQTTHAAETVESRRTQAASLYSDERYSEARPLLEQLATDGEATGALLYRLAYCQRVGGAPAAAVETEAKAVATLETEFAMTQEIEVPFYLVNGYQNQGRAADAVRVAAETTERFAQGQMTRPTTGVGMFQLGKLHEDATQEPQAAEWYEKAVEKLTAEGAAGGSYARRASRFLAERAFRSGKFEPARKYYAVLVDAGEGSVAELDRLAVSAARVGSYAESSAAWSTALSKAGPTNSDRYRYGARLTELAAALDTLPDAAPDGQAWTGMAQTDLETFMQAQGNEAKAILEESAGARSKEERKSYHEPLRLVRVQLVAAALEYTLRGHSIRQAAFFGGYAPLILRPGAWRPAKLKKEPQGETPVDEN